MSFTLSGRLGQRAAVAVMGHLSKVANQFRIHPDPSESTNKMCYDYSLTPAPLEKSMPHADAFMGKQVESSKRMRVQTILQKR